MLLLTLASFVVGLPFGPFGVAIAFSATGLLVRLPILYYVAGRRGPVSTSDLWVRFLAAFAALDTYARRDVVDADHSRRLTPSDSITHLRARWSPYWHCLHLAAQAAAKSCDTPARNSARV